MQNWLILIFIFVFPSLVESQSYEAGVLAASGRAFEAAYAEWKPLAENGDVRAQAGIASLYEMGLGVPRSSAKANYWHGVAAEQGDRQSAASLCFDHFHSQDVSSAHRWCSLAAQLGHPTGHWNLAIMYANGLGVEKDIHIAHMWFSIIGSSKASEYRDLLASQMTSEELRASEQRAENCIKNSFFEC